MLRDKITELLKIKNATIKQLALAIDVSEPSIYRWFNDDSMDLKQLRKIADYFGQDINYFFTDQDASAEKEYDTGIKFRKRVDISLKDNSVNYDSIKDKYIQVLEENNKLQKENTHLKEKLAWYEANCECSKHTKTG
jgi:transcriptional regulator with XRE-family HTH domain